MPLSADQRSKINVYFERFIAARVRGVRKLEYTDLQPNPFLVDLLIQGLGFTEAAQVTNFLVSQRFERGAVTGLGKTLQNIAREVAGPGSASGVEGADAEINRDGIHYFIQIKSGPFTINRDIATRISTRLNSARRIYEETSVALLGVCYGTSDQVNPIARSILDEHGIGIIAGQPFWTFLSNGDSGTMAEVQGIAREAVSKNSGAVGSALAAKVVQLTPLIREQYSLR